MPHWIFASCIIATQIVALFFSVYGIFGVQEHVAPCGWAWGIVVLAISLVYFMILDVVRCYFYLILEDKEKHIICLTYFLPFSPSILLLLY